MPKPGPIIDDYSTPTLNTTFKYRRDKIEGSSGLASTFMLTYFRQGSGYRNWISSTKFSPSGRFHSFISPEAGIEMQHNFDADSTKYKGFVGRTVGKLVFGFGASRPDPDDPVLPNGLWLFNVDATMRYDLIGESYTDKRWHPFIRTSLDFFILYKPVKLIIGGSHVYGDNPVEGFREFKFKPQNFWLIAFKVQK